MKILNLMLVLLLICGSIPAAFANEEHVSSNVPTTNAPSSDHEEVVEPYPPVNELGTEEDASHGHGH